MIKNNTIRNRLLIGLLLFTALFSTVPSRVFAISGTLGFQQPGGNVRVGDTFNVKIVATVGKPFWSGGATVGVTHPPNLQAISASSQGGALGGENPVISGGRTDFTVFNFWGKAVNNEMLFNITYKAIAVGSAKLTFTPGSEVNDGPTTTTPVTYTVIAATCPAGQIGTPPNCTTPAPSPSPKPSTSPKPTNSPQPSSTPKPIVSTPAPITTPTPEETPAPSTDSDGGLLIEKVKVTTNRQENSIAWTINKPEAVPVVTYGISKANQTFEATPRKLEDGSYEADFDSLKLGTLYYFSIKASTPDKLKGAEYNGSLTTRGYPVQLTIQQDGVLAPGAKVLIEGRTFTANKNAMITSEFGEGKFEALITPVGETKPISANFTVAKKDMPQSGNPELQSFTLNALIDSSTSGPDDSMAFVIIGSIVAGIGGIGGFIGFLLYRKRKYQNSDARSVDEDLLIANYGTAMTDYQTNTPTPNLDTIPATQPVENYVEDQTVAMTMEDPSTDIAPVQEPTTETIVVPSFDPSTLPLPPASDAAYEPEASIMDSGEAAFETGQTQNQTAKASPPTTDEPSAVYDETTGELDIIHHHESITPQAPSPARAQ